MKKLSFIICFLCVFFISSTGHCQNEKVNIYFGNGVANEFRDAKKSQTKLQESLDGSLRSNSLIIDWDISHNPTHGLLDLFEVAQQTSGLAWTDFWRALSGLSILPNFLQNELKEIAIKFDEDMVKSNPSIQEHVEKYNKDLCQGEKVVVVAHSQGNLYANIAYKGIKENLKSGFGIVSVANPSWYVAGDNSNTYYTTIEEDIVIGILPWALGSNIDNFSGLNPNDLSGHAFIKSYLASGKRAETRILYHITDRIYTLEWPEGSCEENFLIGTSYVYNYPSPNQKGSPEICIIWDLENKKMADSIPLNSGAFARFPCDINLISDWLDKHTLTGISVLRSNSILPSSFSWAPSDAFDYQFPQDAIERPADEYYDPSTTPLAKKCWTVSINDNEETRQWHRDLYIRPGGDEVGSITTGTAEFESIPVNYNPIPGPIQKDIISLTNVGGTRRRVVSGLYTRYVEEFFYVADEWPHSIIDYDGFQSDYTADLTVKNPFDNDTNDFSLKSWKHYNGFWTGDCEGTETVTESVWNKFLYEGIRDDDFMVVFYAERFETYRVKIPCVSYIWGSYKCNAPLPVNWNQDCNSETELTKLSSLPLKVKAFSQKVANNSNIMDMNPFELSEDAGLAAALKSAWEMAASNPNPEVNPETIDKNFVILIKFIKEP